MRGNKTAEHGEHKPPLGMWASITGESSVLAQGVTLLEYLAIKRCSQVRSAGGVVAIVAGAGIKMMVRREPNAGSLDLRLKW